jgi:putative MATE family efflux protein
MMQNLLSDNINCLFWKLSVPAVLGMVAASAYQFVDSLFIGRWVGIEALSAVSLSYLMVLIINGAGSMIGTGVSSVLSRAIGENDTRTQKSIYSVLLLLSAGLSIVLIPLILVTARPVMEVLSGQPDIADLGVRYMKIIAAGIPFSIASTAVSMAIRAEGRIVTSVTVVAAGTIFNIVLDPVFIKVLGFGLEGAAIATSLSQFISFVICIFWLFSAHHLGKEKPQIALLPRILGIGISGVLMNVMTLIQLAFVYGMIGQYGSDRDIAIIGTCMTFLNLAFVPLWGITQALQPVLGINYGAGQIQRVNLAFRTFSRRAQFVSILLWGIIQMFAKQLLNWFIKNDDIAKYGVTAFRLIFGMFLFYGFFISLITLFQATGKVTNAILLMLCRMLVVFLPVLLITSSIMGINGVWAAFSITDVIVLIAGLILFKLFHRKYLSIDKSL